MAKKKSQRIEAFFVEGELLARLDMHRAGRKLATGKHVTYSTAVRELLERALEFETPLVEENPLPGIFARLDRVEHHLRLRAAPKP